MSAKPRSIPPRLNSHQDAPGPFSLPASADLNDPHTWLHFSTVLIFAIQALANKTRSANNVWASAHLADLVPTIQKLNDRAQIAIRTNETAQMAPFRAALQRLQQHQPISQASAALPEPFSCDYHNQTTPRPSNVPEHSQFTVPVQANGNLPDATTPVPVEIKSWGGQRKT